MANESSGPWRSMCRTTLFSMTLPRLGAGTHRLVFIESLEECQTKIFMHIFAAWRQFVSGFEAHSCHFDIKILIVRSLRASEQHRLLGRSCPWAFGKRMKTIPLKADWEPRCWVAPFMSCPTLESFWGTPDKIEKRQRGLARLPRKDSMHKMRSATCLFSFGVQQNVLWTDVMKV